MQAASRPEQAARHIVQTLREAGHQAFYAGGCVRDRLLGIAAKDFDVATSATPDVVLAMFPRTFAVGAHFGVVLVASEDENATEIRTEVATFRSDGVYSDGRRPDAVRYSLDPREDVERRDFTINGMLYDPLSGEVLDYVGGEADLAAGVVRAIGEPARRFREDKLRMLRAVRFAARFGFTLEEETAAAIRAQAATIHQVSPERCRDELTRMLTEGRARRAFELLDQTGLLRELLPEVDRMHGVEQPPDWHPEGDVWIHTLLLLEKIDAGAPATLAWSALLHDVGKPPCEVHDPPEEGGRIRFNGHAEVGTHMAEAICARLRFSNEETAQIALLVANHMRFGDVEKMKQSTLKRFFRLPRFEEHLALHRMDCLSSHKILRLYDYARHHYEATPAEEVRPELLVNGRDLIAAGYRPGPVFKSMLALAEDAQLEGSITTREQGLALIRSHAGTPATV
ncbi:CCA tRNA nucleotidyltransferase [Acidipila sp. EB88]|uniref:CCA tRNA nucleotidyltransferase n=1 Tax=Acidipila sp. EB88 TaxID=2305226 RepID=UPI000F5E670F|nr:CCA tRNA nucleotidyltransferase [Acidipila sp. EB88]RRA47709.1 CCA tRNA nucleotidyltransferase [Acidipila sp. EB88]